MKRSLKISLFVVSIIILLLFLSKIYISSFVENKIVDLINNSNSDKYTTKVKEVNFKLFDRSITLNNLFIGLKTNHKLNSLSQNIKNDSLERITISTIKINDVYFLDYILKKNVRIGQIEINDVFIRETNKKKSKSNDEKTFNIDSIHIEKINAFEIDRLNFNNIQYSVFDSISEKFVFRHKPVSFNLDGFKLKKVKNEIFKIELIDEIFKINDIELDVSEENYTLFIDEVNLNTKTSNIQVINLKYEPIEGKIDLAKKYKFNNSVFIFDIGKINLYHINLTKLIQNKGVFIDSILISKGEFEFYKDRRKPFDKSLNKKLPQDILKELKIPVYIEHVSFEDCLLLAENRFPHKDMEMKLSINNIYAKINNISNIKDYSNTPVKINVHGNLMNKGSLKVNFIIPMNDPKNTFYFDGSLGTSKFKYYDDIIYPTLGLKILKGNLDKLTFNAKANNYSSSGTMKMLYRDLNATVYKKKSLEKNKFLSWAVGVVLHNSNPVKHKKERVAIMYHKREKFKGFGNYLWKTLQSGIVNTLSPAGNKTSKKADKLIYKKEHKKKKEAMQ